MRADAKGVRSRQQVVAMHDFTPVSALVGGALIGLSASLLLLTHGKVAGISGLYGGVLR
jgi:uncharacterized membrane protein YedE/YeeE